MSTPYDTMPLAELSKILTEIQTRTMLDLVRVVGQAG